jgi:hypothetical protein
MAERPYIRSFLDSPPAPGAPEWTLDHEIEVTQFQADHTITLAHEQALAKLAILQGVRVEIDSLVAGDTED